MVDFIKVRAATMLVSCFLLMGCKIPLFEEIPERDANEIMSVLFANQIPTEKIVVKPGIVSIHIQKERFAEAVQLLKIHGLPKTKYQSFGDIFKKEGLLSTPLEERARYLYARSQEIASTIEHVDGVLECRVNVVLPDEEKNRKSSPKPMGTASVLIRFDSRYRLNDLVPQIKRLVASSIEAVPYENVTLLMLPVELGVDDERLAATRNNTLLERTLVSPVTLAAAGIGALIVLLLAGLAAWFCARTGRMHWLGGQSVPMQAGDTAGAAGDAAH